MATSSNVFDVCRLCANAHARKASMVHMFKSDGVKQHLSDKINCHLPIKVSKDDGLPQLVCHSCIQKLNKCHSFISTCLEANATIQNLLNVTMKSEWMSNDNEEQAFNIGNISQAHEGIQAINYEINFELQATASAKDDDNWISDDWPEDDSNGFVEEPEKNEPKSKRQSHSSIKNPEIALVAIVNTQGKKDFDTSSRLVLVAMDKNECRTLKERKETATSVCQSSKPVESRQPDSSLSLKCDPCGCEFSQQQELIQHFSSHHPSEQTIDCLECSKIVCGTQEVLVAHQEKHLIEALETSTNLQKGLNSYIQEAVKAFVQNPSEYSVMQLGNFNPKTKKFVLTSCLPDKAHWYVQSTKKNHVNETLFKQQEASVRYLCAVCDESYPHSKDYFIDHLIRVHFGKNCKPFKPSFTCNICDKQLTSRPALNKHIEVQHGDKLEEVVCDECGKLVVKQRLNTHKYGHRRKECKYCHVMLAPRAWRRHKKFQENPNAKNDKKTSCMLGPPKRVGKHKIIPCDFCNREIGKQTWMYHLAYQEVFGLNIACPESVPSPFQEQLQPQEQAVFQSRLQNAETAWNLRIKELRESKISKIECIYCKKMLTRAHYKVHLRQHTGDKPFECHYCNKRFAAKNMVHHHITTIHLKLGFNCQYCGKYFSRNRKLLAHEALHRGERNFKCPFCPKHFSGQSNVNGHVKLVHERRYKYRNRSTNKINQNIIVEQPL